MYADRMRIVEELGCSIARGQRERGVLHKIHLWEKKSPSSSSASAQAAFGRLDGQTHRGEIKRAGTTKVIQEKDTRPVPMKRQRY